MTKKKLQHNQQNCPTGKSLPIFRIRVKPRNKKYFALSEVQISATSHRHPVPTRGALAIVTNVGRGCGGREGCDRRARLKRTAKTCGPDVAMLASSSWWQQLSGRDGGKRAVHRGEHVISRKAIAQGRPDALRWTCMLVCALFVHIAHETAGAARTRSSLRPLTIEGEEFPANLGRNRAARTRSCIRCRPREGGDPVFQRHQ